MPPVCRPACRPPRTWPIIPIDGVQQPFVLGGLACYVASVAIWIAALSRVDVSVAYPMLSLGYVVNALAAWALFGEALTPAKVAGILVILVGVIILARG